MEMWRSKSAVETHRALSVVVTQLSEVLWEYVERCHEEMGTSDEGSWYDPCRCEWACGSAPPVVLQEPLSGAKGEAEILNRVLAELTFTVPKIAERLEAYMLYIYDTYGYVPWRSRLYVALPCCKRCAYESDVDLQSRAQWHVYHIIDCSRGIAHATTPLPATASARC